MIETILVIVVFVAAIVWVVYDDSYSYNSELRDYEKYENVCITTRC